VKQARACHFRQVGGASPIPGSQGPAVSNPALQGLELFHIYIKSVNIFLVFYIYEK